MSTPEDRERAIKRAERDQLRQLLTDAYLQDLEKRTEKWNRIGLGPDSDTVVRERFDMQMRLRHDLKKLDMADASDEPLDFFTIPHDKG